MAWATATLADVCEIVSGATPKTGVPAYWDGDVPWATPKDLSDLGGAYLSATPRRITHEGLRSCSSVLLPAGSVLFSSRAPIGHVAINTVPMATNQGFKSLVPRAGRVDAKYLFHWLRANRSYLEGLGNGATFKEVSKAVVARVELPVPPIGEQRRIADILDRADALRAKRRVALALVDDLTQSTFYEMFGDPARNPRSWPRTTLGDVCAKISDGTHHSPKIERTGIPYITAKHLRPHGLDFDADPWFVSEQDHREIYARCDPRPNDVLYIKDGATTGLAAVNRYVFPFSMLSSLALLRPARDQLDAEYLCAWLNNPTVKSRMIGAMGGAAIKRLTLEKIRRSEVLLPDLDLQHKFAARLRSIRAVWERQMEHRAAAELLFVSVQHRAFSGQL